MSRETHLTTIQPTLLIFDWQGTLADNSGNLFSGVRKTLDQLKENNFMIALATSMPLDRMTVLLEENKLENYFDCLQTGDMDYQKPDPKMIEAILEATHQVAADAIMIGDSIADLAMAKKANVLAIGVLSGSDTQSTLEYAKPFIILNNVNELVNLLQVN